MIIYLFFKILYIYYQTGDLVTAVKEIGLRAVIVLLVVGAIITGLKYWSNTLFTYFSTRLDKKDEAIKEMQSEYHTSLITLIDSRHADTLKIDSTLALNTMIQQQILASLEKINIRLTEK